MSTTYVSPQIEAILGYNHAGVHRRPTALGEHPASGRPRGSGGHVSAGPGVGWPLRLRVSPPRARRQDGVVPRQRDRPHGRARASRVHPGRDARHHRRQARRGADRVPRVPRQAHGTPEPHDVRRAPRSLARPGEAAQPRRGGRHGGPRRLQARERLPRPRGGRRAPRAVRADGSATRPERPTSWRGPAGTSSCSCSPTSIGRPASPGGHESVSVAAESVALRIQEALRTPFTVGRHRALHHREPRDQRVPRGCRRCADAAQERGDRDVPVEAIGSGRLRTPREGRRRLDRQTVDVHAAATRRRAGAVDAALPAADRPRDAQR